MVGATRLGIGRWRRLEAGKHPLPSRGAEIMQMVVVTGSEGSVMQIGVVTG